MASAVTALRKSGLRREFVRSALLARKDARRFETIETYCMFVGYPRSGHSLVGSLLDAHPEAVVSHELNALRYFATGFSRNQVFSLILEKSRRDAEGGRKANAESGDYSYGVPGQWQGRFAALRVIGDKRGYRSTLRLLEDPGLLARVRREVRLPMRFVHVTRNPFDNITTMLQKALAQGDAATLDDTITQYFALCDGVAQTHAEAPGEVIDLRHEDLLVHPHDFLRDLCEFVGLKADADYLAACAGILFDSPKRTRTTVEWSPQQIARVEDGIARFDFLAGYSFGT